MSGRELFVVTLRPEPRVAGLRALRLALKSLLRNHGLRCVSVRIALGSDTLEHAHATPVLVDGAAERVAKPVPGHE